MKQPSYSLLMTLAENVRRCRREKGLSQEKFAELCGYHRTYVSDVERGKRNITLLVLETMAVTLEVPAAELISEKKESDNSDVLYY